MKYGLLDLSSVAFCGDVFGLSFSIVAIWFHTVWQFIQVKCNFVWKEIGVGLEMAIAKRDKHLTRGTADANGYTFVFYILCGVRMENVQFYCQNFLFIQFLRGDALAKFFILYK